MTVQLLEMKRKPLSITEDYFKAHVQPLHDFSVEHRQKTPLDLATRIALWELRADFHLNYCSPVEKIVYICPRCHGFLTKTANKIRLGNDRKKWRYRHCKDCGNYVRENDDHGRILFGQKGGKFDWQSCGHKRNRESAIIKRALSASGGR